MKRVQESPADNKILLGILIAAEYIEQEQTQELSAANAEDNKLLTCYFCKQPIEPNQLINLHHTTYKSRGGTKTQPAHERCHIEYHSKQGDFVGWGKLSALTRAWAFNLKNVRHHPAYDFDRAYYSMLYQQ